jgi:nucleoside-diphosphate-sugar epimerase
MNIGIIGANGFIGSHLCAAHLREGNSVIAICNKNSQSVPQGCTIVSFEDAGKISFDRLFVAIGSHAASHEEFIQQDHFLQEVIATLKISRIIFISSIAVYGNHSTKINIDSCYSNPSLYGQAKLAQEFLIKSCKDYVIIRPTYIYGIGMGKNSLLPTWVQHALSTSKIRVYGDGARKQDYLHVDDLANLCVIAGKTSGNHTVIAATGNSCSNKILAEKIAQQIPGTAVEYSGEDRSASFEFDVSKTIDLYQWHPLTSFETGLKKFIQHANTDL